MKKLPNISEAEHQVMKVIWKDNPIASMKIINALTKITDWKPKTIKTLVNRLLNKGAIGYETSGNKYIYYPLIEEKVFVKAESHSFLRRVFGGAMKPMLSTMVENEDLSPEDIKDLKRILEKKKRK
jgi:BlaI family penicillinase repressor